MIYRSFPNLGETVIEERLSNGLLVRVVPKKGFSKTHCFLAVNYGSIDQNFTAEFCYQTPMGVAHYLEHKMFDMPNGNAMQQLRITAAVPTPLPAMT